MKRMTTLAVAVAFALAASTTAASTAWTGMGAPLTAWTKAHPKYTTDCPSGGCFGRPVTVDGRPTHRFVLVSTTRDPTHRIDGYIQEIGDGTPLAAAKAAVLKLLPTDTKTTSFRIVHDGNVSCALWNVQSKTLGGWFAGKNTGDPAGILGINLNAPTSHGYIYKPSDVSESSVGLRADSIGTTC
jgi:hypothetical protein